MTTPNTDLPALGPLRDDPGPLPPEVLSQPRIDSDTSHKIRSVCFILSVAVVFNHAATYEHVWDWQGYRTEPLPPGYFASAPVEIAIQQFLSGALGRITNPVFFLVSGFLFFYAWKPDAASWKRKLRRRAFTLLMPFFVWGFMGMFLNYLNYLGQHWRALLDPELRGPFGWGDVLVTFFNQYPPTQLWFLRDLMLIMVFGVPVLVLAVRLRPFVFLPILAAAYFLMWSLPVADKNGFCFFALGAYLGCRQFQPQYPSHARRAMAIVLWLALACAYTILAIATDWNLQILFKCVVLAGIGGIWAAYDLFPASWQRALDRVSAFRFFVYMGFDPLLPILEKPLLAAVPPSEWWRLLVYFVLPLAVSALCVLAAWTINRWWPRFYYVITGGRLPAS